MTLLSNFLIVALLFAFKEIKMTDAARDCSELLGQCINTDGVYTITLQANGKSIQVYCEFKEGAGWTRFQRREDGSVNFYRTWSDYKQGFGNVTSEHWLGNDYIHHLTTQATYTLRVDFELWDGSIFYAEYSQFKINGEDDKYRLLLSGYSGTAGDSMWQRPSSRHIHNNMKFTTHDSDNDQSPYQCSHEFRGGWWYNACFAANLNGAYWTGGQCPYSDKNRCIQWYHDIGVNSLHRKITMLVKDPSAPGLTTPGISTSTTPPTITSAVLTTIVTSSTTPSPIQINPPVLEIRLEGAFRSVDNTAFPSGCVDAYNIQLESKAKAKVDDVNQEMTSLCSSTSDVLLTYEGTQVSTDGSMGRVTFAFNLVGTLDVTIQALSTCSNSIAAYLQPHSNWDQPLIGDVLGCPSVKFDQDYFNVLYFGWACDSACLNGR